MPSTRSDSADSPATVSRTRRVGSKPQQRASGRQSAREASPRILIVEDDYLAATEAEAALSDAGYEVIGPAISANEAVRIARSEQPALIVMDIRLSGKRDGVDAAREILETTGIHCIFATAHNTSEVRERAAAACPLGWLPKPYSTEALLGAIESALAKSKP
jgi:DNA-binding NarL/FixJ family response regulator